MRPPDASTGAVAGSSTSSAVISGGRAPVGVQSLTAELRLLMDCCEVRNFFLLTVFTLWNFSEFSKAPPGEGACLAAWKSHVPAASKME